MREDTYSVSVRIAGIDYGVWDKLSGGEVDSEETTYRPGGMAEPITLGGARNFGPITVSRLYDEWIAERVHTLIDLVGKAEVTVTRQPLDANGDAFGKPLVYTARLKAITLPDVDSEGSGAALIEIEATVSAVA